MSLAKRYGLGTAKWVFLAQFGSALVGLGAFRGKELPERLAGGFATGLGAALVLGGLAALWGWWRGRKARHSSGTVGG